MKIDGIPNMKAMDDELKRNLGSAAPSVQSDTEQAKFSDNKTLPKIEADTDVDLTFEKDKWTPCS